MQGSHGFKVNGPSLSRSQISFRSLQFQNTERIKNALFESAMVLASDSGYRAVMRLKGFWVRIPLITFFITLRSIHLTLRV